MRNSQWDFDENDVEASKKLMHEKTCKRTRSILILPSEGPREKIFDSKYIKSLNDLYRADQLIVRELSESPRCSFLKSQNDFMRVKSEICLKQTTKTVNGLLSSNHRKSKKLKKKRSRPHVHTNETIIAASTIDQKPSSSSPKGIDHEDDIIFNDEDDSLSSTVFSISNPKLDYLSTKSLNSLKNVRNKQSMRSLNFPVLIKDSSPSISDIDPDENILKHILIKSDSRINL